VKTLTTMDHNKNKNTIKELKIPTGEYIPKELGRLLGKNNI
jgi:hypothetical protein